MPDPIPAGARRPDPCRRRLLVLLFAAAMLAPPLLAAGPIAAQVAARHALVRATEGAHAAVVASADAQTVPADLTPPLTEVGTDFPAPWGNGCLLEWTPIEQPPCTAGDPTSATTIALFGDSHAAQWFPALDEIAEQRNWRLRTVTKVVCPPLPLPLNLPYLDRAYTECDQWRDAAVERLRAERPTLVILDMRRFYDLTSWGVQTYDDRWLRALGRMVRTLRAAGSSVLVLGPLPEPGADVPTCVTANPTSLASCNPLRADAIDAAGIAAERAAVLAAGGEYADLTPLFCARVRCPVVVGGTLVYVDNDHLTASYVRSLTPVLSAVLDTVPSVRRATVSTGPRPDQG
jgi:hypothetical protein